MAQWGKHRQGQGPALNPQNSHWGLEKLGMAVCACHSSTEVKTHESWGFSLPASLYIRELQVW